jgi:hypothetical protein
VSDSVLALRAATASGRELVARPRAAGATKGRRSSTRARRASEALVRQPPGSVVTLAGLQGGAGTSTTTLVLATAVSAASDHAALTLDVAGATSGGLGNLAGCVSQSTAHTTAQLVLEGAPMARPYVVTAAGVHLIGGPPDTFNHDGALGHDLVAQLSRLVAGSADDTTLAAACRQALLDVAFERTYGQTNGPGAQALLQFIAGARTQHSLVALDLGVPDIETLSRFAPAADLHVWVVAARQEDFDCVLARLTAQPSTATAELILAWIPPSHGIRAKDLRKFSDARNCDVVKLPNTRVTDPWQDRASAAANSLTIVCERLP